MAAVGNNGKDLREIPKADWDKQRERFKDTACPRATKDLPCPYHANGERCFYSHDEFLIKKAKAKPDAKAKAKPKTKGKGKGDKGLTPEEKEFVPCRQFRTQAVCSFGDA